MYPEVIVSSGDMSVRSIRNVKEGKTVGLVPTMGALHAGHLQLVDHASRQVDEVVVSIFVNPTQFGPGEDLDAYPRNLASDVDLLRKQGLAHVVFAPEVIGMYPFGANKTWTTVEGLGDHLCGASRPGHFKGVTTIVARFLSIIRPDIAFFGLKDAQQYFIVKRMAKELGFMTQISGIPTVREADGLALSSRNQYLNETEREQAHILSKAVRLAKEHLESGRSSNASDIVLLMRQELLKASLGEIDYVSVVDTHNLMPLTKIVSGTEVLCAVAVQFGKARLIDNSIARLP